MEFLKSAWNWVCGVVSTVWSWLKSTWDWVENEVEKAWNTLRNKSVVFCELFALKLLAKRIRAKYDELRNKLSSADQKELDDLLDQIDARG